MMKLDEDINDSYRASVTIIDRKKLDKLLSEELLRRVNKAMGDSSESL